MQDLKELSNQISAERALLSDVVDNITNFVLTYDDIKKSVEELKGTENFNIQSAVESIKNSLTATQNEINQYLQKIEENKENTHNIGNELDENLQKIEENIQYTHNVGKEIANLQTKFQLLKRNLSELDDKMQEFISMQRGAINALSKLDSCISNIKSIDFSRIETKINNYSERVEKLSETIKNEVSLKLEENNKKVAQVENYVMKLIDKFKDNNVGELITQIKTLNTLISESQKEKFALSQEVDVELNSWADRNGIKRKKR
jgi:chromosome segregation ATPase